MSNIKFLLLIIENICLLALIGFLCWWLKSGWPMILIFSSNGTAVVLKEKLGNTIEKRSGKEFKKMETPEQLIKRVLRDEINKRLEEITPPQKQKFNQIFPNGLNSQTEEKLRSALDLCNRTVVKNRIDAGDKRSGK